MTAQAEWLRVSRAEPCPVCQHGDWCTTNADLGLILCMRVESSRPSKNSMGGWLHSMDEKHDFPRKSQVQVRVRAPEPSVNFSKLLSKWAAETPELLVVGLAGALGVSLASLLALNATWAKEHRAWAFPMSDGYGEIVGIRLRSSDGRKWAVKGSRMGTFLPQTESQPIAFICEGPTDTAAALTLGLFAIGRPSCLCGGPEIKTACNRLGVRRVAIVADNDEPGLRGADKIAADLKLPSVTWVPSTKDLREFVRMGGTRSVIEAELRNKVWKKK